MIFVAIGANLSAANGASPLDTCRAAAAALDAIAGLRLVGLSRWYRTAPVPPSDQPDYINGMAQVMWEESRGKIAPAALLAALQSIEAASGRVRGVANAARILDLDIIAMGGLVRDAPDPVLPHPRAHLRAFVLAPLVDLAPGWVHPILGRTARDLLACLPPQDCHAL